jgi:hypothetical protein
MIAPCKYSTVFTIESEQRGYFLSIRNINVLLFDESHELHCYLCPP